MANNYLQASACLKLPDACRRGYPTQWCDAYSTVVSRMKALVDQQ